MSKTVRLTSNGRITSLPEGGRKPGKGRLRRRNVKAPPVQLATVHYRLPEPPYVAGAVDIKNPRRMLHAK